MCLGLGVLIFDVFFCVVSFGFFFRFFFPFLFRLSFQLFLFFDFIYLGGVVIRYFSLEI